MELSETQRRMVAGLVAAGEDRAEVEQAVALSHMIQTAALDRFKSVAEAAAVPQSVRSKAIMIASMEMFELFAKLRAIGELKADQAAKKMGSEQTEITRDRIRKAVMDFDKL